MLELATGLATETVFREPNSTLSERTHAYGASCGRSNLCDSVRRSSGGLPTVIKTHAPFITVDKEHPGR